LAPLGGLAAWRTDGGRSHKPPALPTRPKKQRFTLTVEGQPMIVEYTPNWMGSEFATGHFEFRSPLKPARRIPVSETGYRSHFADVDTIEAADSPQEYARLYALNIIRRVPPERVCAVENAQPSLFGLLD
jgi:hypothetical protein